MKNFFHWLQLWSFRTSKDNAIDILFFHKFRSFKDGITYFELIVNHDLYEGDHNPKLDVKLAILNVYLIQFEWYNINHA